MNSQLFDLLNNKLRDFFRIQKGFREIPAQMEPSILSACEDPETVTVCSIGGQTYPLPQTGQMRLEEHLLKDCIPRGVFCQTTSYRDEIRDDRHDVVFNMFEFESWGTIDTLINLIIELLAFLNLPAPIKLSYLDACKQYNTSIIEPVHEVYIQRDYGNAVILHHFPRKSHPFWNMKEIEDDLFNKVDVLLFGVETLGSAERSCYKEGMLRNFHKVSDGKYVTLLYNKFGKENVDRELEEYLSLPMLPRFGGGIGMTRLSRCFEYC